MNVIEKDISLITEERELNTFIHSAINLIDQNKKVC